MVKDQFWFNLKENYLNLLQHSKFKPTNSKGLYSKLTPEVGRVVMIHDEDMRLGW